VDWAEFFAMGGYAFYVWGAYASTELILLWEVLALIARRRTQARNGLSVARENEVTP
jgi:heme exporter protein CcmD